jgi:hypothetical protein
LAEPRLVIEVSSSTSVAELRGLIAQAFEKRGALFDSTLLSASAIASEERVLSEGEAVGVSGVVALLPPVCGG